MSTLSLFVATAPGIEPLAEAEVRALGIARTRVVAGGVEVEASPIDAGRLLVSLRTASHLLVRVASFRADRFDRMEKHVRAVDWRRWLSPGVPRKVRATAEKSRLYHTGAITERVARFVAEALGDGDPKERGEGDDALPLAVRFVHDEATISLDLGGAPLHRRGYRLDPGKAPLREDLAAALLLAAGWDGATPLLDPMCGSGTIAIEAAMIARQIAPGLSRAFGVERTPLAAAMQLDRARNEARAAALATCVPIHASDRDPKAVARTKENAARAGVLESLTCAVAPLSSVDVSALAGRAPLLATNPPWGERLSHDRGLSPLHAALGALVGRLGEGARLALIAADPRAARSVGVPLRSALLTTAGGLKVSVLVSDDPSRRGASA